MLELDLIALFARPLQSAGIHYIITGSIAAIYYGEPRLTLDVDMVVFLTNADATRMAKIFPANDFYLPPPEAIAEEIRREERGHFNIIHVPTALKADIYVTRNDELEKWAFRHQRRAVLSGETISIAPPEYVIVRKLEYFREGRSEKHLRDVRSMLAVSKEDLNEPVLQDWIRRKALQAEWKLVSGH